MAAQAVNSLLMAIIAASEVPLVLLDGDCTVLAASRSFVQIYQMETVRETGLSLYEMQDSEWDVPELRSLLNATISGHPQAGKQEIDHVRRGRGSRRLVLGAERLTYADPGNTRMLLTIADVTDARLTERIREKALLEKTVLLKELQHRIANSLQIIASVLMQSASRIQSEETRTHLYDAHRRVMSVAAIQRHLSSVTDSDVGMRAYLTELCQSIRASMMNSDQNLELHVEVDDSMATADFSMSIGLVVTELVINALKHAFVNRRGGTINVTYNGRDKDWLLSVVDDGVGIPTNPLLRHAGLGSSIVSAIAHRLSARIERADANPGTRVSISSASRAKAGTSLKSM
ncbi:MULTISPECIES: sensor histidine kinase [Sphingosinicellaceae]|uniref:sensor histidine kinase n=1 Tax=Sphingosinicellaceae TaxID=2820280 RepID=UPI001C1E1CB3|nr:MULTISPECIES: sensor histidine kinase [Polymorphobacter]QYE35650.1 sensor histidine kinase [Polymorphobacter sp. PAMC 29334]UAJ10985.1 sensor histidine kinase [Polymorphobacter megasporae]